MQARAGLADLAGDRDQRDQAARVVGAVHVLADAHAPEDHRALGRREGARHLAQRRRRDAADRRHRLRAVAAHVLLQRLEVVDARLRTNSTSTRPSSITVWISALSIATSVSALNCSVRQACARQLGAARVGEHDLRAALRRVLHPGRGDRMVLRRVRADHEDQLGVLDVVDRVAHRARADAFEQRRDARRVAQARAVVDVVAAEAGAHQLLEQVGLLVAALGRAEAGQRLRAVRVAQARAACRRRGRAPLPRSLRERPRDQSDGFGTHAGILGDAGLADQRLGQPLRMAARSRSRSGP